MKINNFKYSFLISSLMSFIYFFGYLLIKIFFNSFIAVVGFNCSFYLFVVFLIGFNIVTFKKRKIWDYIILLFLILLFLYTFYFDFIFLCIDNKDSIDLTWPFIIEYVSYNDLGTIRYTTMYPYLLGLSGPFLLILTTIFYLINKHKNKKGNKNNE